MVCFVFFLVFAMVLVLFHGFWWFFLAFTMVSSSSTKTSVKTKKNHEFWILRDSLKIVFFFSVSGFLQWFWLFFMVSAGFSWFLLWI